jgi:hypothetical protein
LGDRRAEAAMTRWWLRAVPVLWIGVWVLLAASVPAGATTLTWSVVPSPNPGSGYNILNGVSCVSPAVCTAVGYDRAGTPFHTVVESWNGAKWSVVRSPSPAGSVFMDLTGVSCVSAAACIAVGYYETSTGTEKSLIESWNGTSWSVAPSPHPASSVDNLNGVSCVSVNACTAVGYHYLLGSGIIETLVESWNGTRWTVAPSPNPASAANVLDGVSCVSAVVCTAVGFDYETPNAQRTLVESWNGTAWSAVPSPNRPSSNALDGVSCASATACTAVGSHGDRRSTRSLIESWDGVTWSLVTSPNPGIDYDYLYGVSCPTAAACTAVGKYNNPGTELTLVESWNGTKWTVTHSPSPGTVDMLNGVSCPSAATCTAVGSNGRNSQSPPETLIETGR